MYHIPFAVPSYSFVEAVAQLKATRKFGIQPLLESVEDMNAELGHPDEHFESVQIAGTNGKTSTARYTAQILMGEGKNVALYTSPELVSMTERMEIQGHPVSEVCFAHGIAAAVVAGQRVNARRKAHGERPYDITEFDLLTVGALVIFAEEAIDVAVLECGMGGRWDATSATHNIRSVAITGIGLDHQHILGDTLENIAAEKAAIIQHGRSCVLGVGTATPDSVEDVFLERCVSEAVVPCLVRPQVLSDAAGEMHEGIPRRHEELPCVTYRIQQSPHRIGAPLIIDVSPLVSPLHRSAQRHETFPREVFSGYTELSALKPAYQAANIACAIVLSEQYLGRALDADKLFDAIVRCPTPGRFDLVRPAPPVLVDACHNPQSVQTFLTAIRDISPRVADRPALLCAVLADKDARGMVELLASEFPTVYVTRTTSPRALPAEELAQLFVSCGVTPHAIFASVAEAVQALRMASFVACGSITTAGEVAALLRPGVQNAHGGDDLTLHTTDGDGVSTIRSGAEGKEFA